MILRDRHDPEDFSHWDARGNPPAPRLLSVLAVLVLLLAALAVFADVWLPAIDKSTQWLEAPRPRGVDQPMTPREKSKQRLAAAFEEWMRRYQHEPDRFEEDWLKGEPKSYGEAAANYLTQLLDELPL